MRVSIPKYTIQDEQRWGFIPFLGFRVFKSVFGRFVSRFADVPFEFVLEIKASADGEL